MNDTAGSANRADLLSIYLNDHLVGATAGLELVRRLADAQSSGEEGERLRWLANQVAEDRASLITAMEHLDVRVDQVKAVLGWLGEKLGRLKLNGYIFARSPLSTVVELEAMRLAVEGKAAGWRTLRALAEHDDRLDAADLDRLIDRAAGQAEALEAVRVATVRRVLVPA